MDILWEIMSERISRRDVFKLGGAAAVAATTGIIGYKIGKFAAEQKTFDRWPEAALLRAGGSELIGEDTKVYEIQREGGPKEKVTEIFQAYRLPNNPYLGKDITSVAIISQGKKDSQGPQERPFYGSGVAYLPTQGFFGFYPNGETKGEHVLDFGLRLSLGVEPIEEEIPFNPRVHDVKYYWGQQQVPGSDDIDLFSGTLVTERYPKKLVRVPQIVMVAPDKFEVMHDIPSIVYSSNYGQRTVPLPSASLVDINKNPGTK